MKIIIRRSILVATMLVAATCAIAQEVGKPVTLGIGVRETTASIMRRAALESKIYTPRETKSEEGEGPDRSQLSRAPGAIAGSQWPPKATSPIELLQGAGDDDIKPGPLPLWTVGSNFGGPDSTETGFRPPDTTGDVSPSSVLIAINGRIKSYNRAGVVGSLDASTAAFFASVAAGVGVSDPRIIFDKLTNRWFVEIINVTSTNNLVMLAVSDGEAITATTAWTYFVFNQNVGGGPAGFADYCTLGVDANAVYIGSNRFGSAGGFNCDMFVVRKSSVLGAGPIVVTPFRSLIGGASGMFTPWGCTSWDPAATVGVLIGVDGRSYGRLTMRRVTNPGGFPILSADLVVNVLDTNDPIDTPVNAGASAGTVDALDDRLFYARILQDRISGRRTIWTAHNIATGANGVSIPPPGNPNDRTSGRWYEIDNVFAGAPTMRQAGTAFDNAPTSPRFFSIPSVAMNMQGHAVIGGTYGNFANPLGVATAHRFSTDPLGNTTSPVVRQAGTGTYLKNTATTTNQRWGDYSTTIVDPADGQSVWTFQEYVSATNVYAVRAIKLLAPAPSLSSISPTSSTQGTSLNLTLTGLGIFDPGAGFPNRLAVSMGSGITVNSVTWVGDTSCTVNATISAGATVGARTVTLTNPDGQSATVPFTVNSGSKTVTGSLTLSSYVGSVGSLPLTVEIRDNVTSAVLQTTNLTGLMAGNVYTVPTTLANGTYKLRFKFNNRFLGKIETLVLGSGTTTVNSTLLNGDINGDNSVGSLDFNALRAAWGSATGGIADLNGDGSVGSLDFNIMRATWGQSGQ